MTDNNAGAAGGHGPCPALTLNPVGRVLAANPALAALLDIPPVAVLGQPFDHWLTVPSKVLWQSYLVPLLKLHGQVAEIALTLRTPAGRRIDVLFYSQRRHPAGDSEIDVVLAPIAERKRIEAELQRVKLATSDSPSLLFQWLQWPDGRAHLPFASDAVRRLYGLTPEQVGVSAQGLLDTLAADDRAHFVRQLAAAASRQEALAITYRTRLDGGAWRLHAWQGEPRALAGGLVLWQGHIMDVTSTAQPAPAASAAGSDGQAHLRLKVRAPLLQALDALQNGGGAADAAASRPLATALGHVDALLDWPARPGQAGPSDRVLVELGPSLAAVLAEHQTLARALAVSLHAPAWPDGLATWADPEVLSQALRALTRSALLRCPAGGRLAWTALADGTDAALALAEPPGAAAPCDGDETTDPDQRLAQACMAQLAGSCVGSHDAVSGGHRTTLRLPLASRPGALALTAAQPGVAPPEQPWGHSSDIAQQAIYYPTRGRLLLVEANEVHRVLMEAVVGMRPGIEMHSVGTGDLALQWHGKGDADLVLIDMKLPDMPVEALLSALRKKQPSLRAVVLSSATATSPPSLQDLPLAGCWTKPVDIDRVLGELDRLLGPETAR